MKTETAKPGKHGQKENARFDTKALKNNYFRASLAGLGGWLAAALATEQVVLGLAFGGVCFAGAMVLPRAIAGLEKSKKQRRLERELPFALLSMSTELSIGVQFERALEHCSRESGSLAFELRKALAEVRMKGSSIQEALFALSERSNSVAFKRSIAHLVGVYEQGGNKKTVAESLRRIALEQLNSQRIEAKAFSQKLVVFSLMFIAVSAIIPALFQAFVVVGSAFLEVSLTPMQAFLIPTVLFPSIDLGILAYVKAKTPVFLEE